MVEQLRILRFHTRERRDGSVPHSTMQDERGGTVGIEILGGVSWGSACDFLRFVVAQQSYCSNI